MKKKNLAIVCGGYSKESVISVKSAANIKENIDLDRYEPYLVVIEKDNWYCELDGKKYPVDKNDFSINLNGEKINFASALITIHGDPGENGKLQGYFDLIAMPYNTPSACVSAITFNKFYCNSILAQNGIRVSKSKHIFKGDVVEPQGFDYPCFVKPNAGGSSIGMSKVNRAEDLLAAVQKAFAEDSEVMIEKYIKGKEFSCGLMPLDGKLQILGITEIVPKAEYFDYEAKYNGTTDEITPARISKELADKIAEISKRVYKILHCNGLIRCDFIVEDTTSDIYFLEVNTTPGMSSQSIVPKQVAAMNPKRELKDIFTELIETSKYYR